MPVIIDGKSIIPGPFVGITKEFVRGEDGKVRRRQFSLLVRGRMLSYAGSPRADGSWWTGGAASPPPLETVPVESRLTAIRNKQAAVVAAFGQDGRPFEVQPWDGSPSIRCYPRVKGVEFAEGRWTETCDFTVQLEADNVWFGGVDGGGGSDGVEPEESWAVEVQNENSRTYRVSHTASSQQRAEFDETGAVVREGWEVARDVVLPHLGQVVPDAVLPPPAQSGYLACNYSRAQQVDAGQGRYSVTENWLYTPGQRYVEEFVVNSRGGEGRTRVTVDGTISGFAPADVSLTAEQARQARWERAEAGWAAVLPQLLERAQNYSGVTLNPLALGHTVGFNPVQGVITYSYEFDTRRASLVPGSISETLTVTQQNPADVFAQLVVLGRPAGPVLQGIGTVTSRVRAVTAEVVMPGWQYGQPQPVAPDLTAVLLTYHPGSGFLSKDDESWSAENGRYTRNVVWTY